MLERLNPFSLFREAHKQENLSNDLKELLEQAGLEVAVVRRLSSQLEEKIIKLNSSNQVIDAIRSTVQSFADLSDEQKTNLLNTIITQEAGEDKLKADWQEAIENYFESDMSIVRDAEGLAVDLEKDNKTDEQLKQFIPYIKAYLRISVPEDEFNQLEDSVKTSLNEAFENLISERRQIKPESFWHKVKTKPGYFASQWLKTFDELAQGEVLRMKFTERTLNNLPLNIQELIRGGKLGVIQISHGFEIHISRKEMLILLKKFTEAQKGSIEAWQEIEKRLPLARGLKERIKAAFSGQIEAEMEMVQGLDKQAQSVVEMMLKCAEEIIENGRKAGLTDDEWKIVEGILEEVQSIVKIREERKPDWQKSLLEKIQSGSKKLGKWIWENGKTLGVVLGTGFLLWGAVFAFYLPVLIADYAEKKVGGK
jgi:hypothetical protein